jgi:hypothetical protein
LFSVSFTISLGLETLPLTLGSLRQPECFPNFQLSRVAPNSEIGSENYITVDSEIGNGAGAIWTLFFRVITIEIDEKYHNGSFFLSLNP